MLYKREEKSGNIVDNFYKEKKKKICIILLKVY